MNTEQLRHELIANNIPPSWYCLNGGLPNEQLCITQTPDGKWITYYSERGSKSGLKHFETEKEACESFLKVLVDAFLKNRR